MKIVAFLLLLPSFGYAQQMLYARCGEPVGTRYDQAPCANITCDTYPR